jgi:hypothetical protein
MNTLIKGLRLSNLSKMDSDSKKEAIRDFLKSGPILTPADIDEKIHQYEVKYGITSEQMLKEVGTGKFSTYEGISSWLMLLKMKNGSESKC